MSEIESLVSSLIDGSTDSIITTDINGIIKSWNKGAEEIFGHNAEDMVGKYIGVIYPPELKDERKGWQKKIMEGETIRNQRTKIYNSADELVDINLTLSPLKDKDGKLVGTIGIAKDITHVIKAEEALLESEKRYRELFDNSLNGVALHNIVTDENGIPVDYIFLEANTSFEKLTGLKVKDIIGKRVTEVIPGIEETSLIKTYGEVALTGNPIEFEQYVPQLERHYAITAFSPRKGQFAAVFSDITERKQAEQALRESEEKFRGLAEKSPNMIFINKKGRVIFANEKCEEMMGYTREEFYSPDFDFMALIVPEHRELIMRTFQRHMKGEEVEPYEYTLVTKDGRRIDVIQTTRLIQSEGETAILGMLTDITERKKAEESVKRSEKYLQKIIEASPYCIVTTDLKGMILSFNKAAEETYGYTAEEIIGKETTSLQPKDVTPEKNKAIYEALLNQEEWEGELLNVRKNGEVFPTYLRTRSITDDRGNPVGLLSLSQDITERKKMEQDIKNYTLELEHSNQIKDLFIDIIRHDLLNPVGIILNLVELIEDTGSYGGIEEELQMIKRNTKTLQEMIEDASEYARVESIDDFVFEKIDLSNIIKDAVDSLHGLASEKGITIENEVTGRYLAYVNPFIKDVFFNLVSNAIKYSPENSRVIVDLKDAGTEWIISVKDNGIGISDEYKEKIFLRFKRVSKEGVRGSGLGLAIVKMIVDLHNGKVWVEDNPEGGSVFNVKLPKRTKK